jgi:adenylate kinase
MDGVVRGPHGNSDVDLVELVSRFILIGPPGSGKGTQGQVLAQALRVPHIATGDLIREVVQSGSENGKKFKALIDNGRFISDEDVVTIVNERLEQPDGVRGYILDGFPRSVAQAELFSHTAPGLALDRAISLLVPEAEIIDRLGGRLTCLACGASYHLHYRPSKVDGVCDECGEKLVRRADDEPDSIRQRLSIYENKTAPLIEFYRKSDKLIEIDATGTTDEIFGRLINHLKFDVTKKRIR